MTLEVYRLDLRQWIAWLDTAGLDPFDVERAHIELYARWCESEGKARATIGRRLSTICGFYRYCAQERLIDRDRSAHVRRPKQDYESSTLGLDRNEFGGPPGIARSWPAALTAPITQSGRSDVLNRRAVMSATSGFDQLSAMLF